MRRVEEVEDQLKDSLACWEGWAEEVGRVV